MKPVEFKGHNIVFGKDQPQYQPLPALALQDQTGTIITCWEPTEEEIQEIVKNRKIYVSMFTFNQPVTPINLQTSLDAFFDIRTEAVEKKFFKVRCYPQSMDRLGIKEDPLDLLKSLGFKILKARFEGHVPVHFFEIEETDQPLPEWAERY